MSETLTAPRPLGPGDDDPRSPARTGVDASRIPLEPGADDPASPAGRASGALVPLAPGAGDGRPGPDFLMVAPPAAGPGSAGMVARHRVRVTPRTADPAETKE